uniref:Uncharacterized protein n=1 Tax=Romanomermis culicivorax TaxID=13658 RepID=A0A915I645_ROMCU
MLHAFYGLMRLFCTHSLSFAESVMMHENFEFACRSVSMNDVLGNARDEIFGTIEICMRKFQSQKDKLKKFREKLCSVYLGAFSTSKTHYFTFLRFMRSFETDEDKIHLLQNQILPILSNNFFGVHEMHHNATGCCCINELIEMLRRILDFLKFLVALKESAEKCLKRIVVLCDPECVKRIMTMIIHTHRATKLGNNVETLDRLGPYFPRRSHALSLMSQQHLRKVHPPHPMFNMCLHPMLVEANKGIDTCYDQYMNDFFSPYHTFVDRLLRVACNLGTNLVSSDQIAECSGLIGVEGSVLHSVYYVKFWLDLWQKHSEIFGETGSGKDVKERIESLKNSKFLREYVETILLNEQSSLSVAYIFSFMKMILNELSLDLVTSQIKKQCLENAGNVLKEQINWPTVDNASIFERMAPMLATRIGALRIILLFSQSAFVVESLKSENFCQLIDEWTQKFKQTLSACEIITTPAAEYDAATINIRPCTSSQAVSSTMRSTHASVNVPCWLNVETKQQILKLAEIMDETVSELKQKIVAFDFENCSDTDAA